MVRGAIVTILFIAVLTVGLMKFRGDGVVKARWVIPLWGGGIAFVIAAGTTVWWFGAVRDYDACVERADRSRDGRIQTEQLYDTIDVATDTDRFTSAVLIPGKPSLREALDINLPVLDRDACLTLKP